MIEGMQQEARPRADWPYAQDWIVLRYEQSERHADSLYIEGINLNSEVGEYGYRFSWIVPKSTLSWRYDFTWAHEGQWDLDNHWYRNAGIIR